MEKTWKDALKTSLTLLERSNKVVNYQTFVDHLFQTLVAEVKEIVRLLPQEYDVFKKCLDDDVKRIYTNNGMQINAYAYGNLQRDLQHLGVVSEGICITRGFNLRNSDNGKKVFISHSSKDKDIVESFVNNILCLGAGLSSSDIFCTSIEGMKITNGEDIRKHIQTNINYADYAILLISENYKNSSICLNEMGAVWAIDKKVKTYVLPGLSESQVGWLMEVNVAEKVNDIGALMALLDELSTTYKLPTKASQWAVRAQKFCEKINRR